jgi:D-alanyl-D-alanine carboxypeptidase/D-alanyl-D-alanine-endopeptidase (penicillin-binding protein 4)
VIKLATSFAALDRFGPDYHFETSFYAAGKINSATKTLNGNLVLHATGDPLLTTANLNQLIREVIKAGVTHVTGSLVVTGPFTYATYYTASTATKRLETLLRKLGVRIAGPTRKGTVSGTLLASHMSANLKDIIFDQNARSSNPIAERLGVAVGGPKSVEDFLVSVVGVPRSEVLVGRTSGLNHNRISARATIQLLRHLVLWLNLHNMQPEDIMPVAGLDPGTLNRRFATDDYRGAVVGKTGTLNVTDGGVSSLAGIMYTRDRGPVLFAIFNTKGSVNTYRQLQDTFLKDMIGELGGMPEINGSSHRLGN